MRCLSLYCLTSPFVLAEYGNTFVSTKTIYLPLQFLAQEATYNWFGLNMYISLIVRLALYMGKSSYLLRNIVRFLKIPHNLTTR